MSGSVSDGGHVDASADAACVLASYPASLTKSPVDIVLLIDNSFSMSDSVGSIETNMNAFAQALTAAGTDPRLLVLSQHGSSDSAYVCIDPPLGGAPCATSIPLNTPPSINPPGFYHYDNYDVGSTDGWCKLIAWANAADRYGLMPNGWLAALRPDAFKNFVVVTDDQVECIKSPPSPLCSGAGCDYNDDVSGLAAAQKLDTDITALSPLQFGTPSQRRYVWDSIIGVPEKSGQAHLPTDPLVPNATHCGTANSSSEGNQQLSILTGGLRFSVCDVTQFATVFASLAAAVVKRAPLECHFALPVPPEGKQLDMATMLVDLTFSTGGTQTLSFVANAGSCAPGGFHVTAGEIHLCPDSCATIQNDPAPTVVVRACTL